MGDFHVNTTGDNLPNEDGIRAKGSMRAADEATGPGIIDEFVYSPEVAAMDKKYTT
jgi:hypothetical protein